VTKRIKHKKHRRKGATRVGLAWYRPWQWQRLRTLAVDRETIENTYIEWLAAVQQRQGELNQIGVFPVKVDVDVDELAAWCRQKGVPLDGQARADFVAYKCEKGEYISE
jgi:hypothetical protein